VKFIKPVIWLFVVGAGFAHAQQHVHGQGTVFLAQEDTHWQVQYILPAADVLGFEHVPQSKQQRAALSELKETLKSYDNLMQFSTKCEQDSYAHNLSEFEEQSQEKHHKHEKHNDHDHHDNNHSDIELSYVIKCSENITYVSFSVFDKLHSLEKLDVQWSVNRGQGSATVNNASPKLEFK